MKTLIAYASKKGATKDMAARIAGALGDADLLDLRDSGAGVVDLSGYGAVVLGAPSYMGTYHKAATAWATARAAELSTKTVALFELGTAVGQVSARTALPALCARAAAVAKLGGELRWKRLSFIERIAMKAVIGATGDLSTIDDAAVEAFIDAVRKATA